MTTRINIYNDALLLCGERALNNLSETVEARRLLDQVWNNGGVRKCLEQGQWFFAMRSVQIDYDTDISPSFGYTRGFSKPTDWVLTSALCSDEFFRVPLLQYTDEAGYWYSDLDTIYVKYVSDDENFGGNLAGWPDSFQEFVSADFAFRIVTKIADNDKKLATIAAIRKECLKHARSRCAMALPTRFSAQGGWSKARMRGHQRRDGGNTGGNLIG